MDNTINSSDINFIQKVLSSFKKREPFVFNDDRNYGFSENDFSNALYFLKKIKEEIGFSWKEFGQVLAGTGVCSAGLWIIRVAILDPEPTSKLWLLISGGAVLAVVGSLTVINAFGMTWSIECSKNGFKVIPVR